MLLWIIAAILTLGACLAVLLPLVRRETTAVDPREHDLAVYRDQLREIDRDAARGLIDRAEAEQARAEIGRRMLKISAELSVHGPREQRRRRLATLAAVLSIPLVSWGVYGMTGSPGLPGEPLAERLSRDPSRSTIEELVARAERHLADNPSDGRGWDVLAPIYLRMERPADAATAYRNAIRLNGASGAREAGLGEALALAAGGVVTADAQAAFERALAALPGDAKARFFLATADAQEGRTQEAVAAWTALRQDLPEGSPWRVATEQAITGATRRAAAPGPDAAEVEAAEEMSEADRAAMIEGMVARLDERLRDNPGDPEGWIRLVRSYMILGRRADAQSALDRATTALGDRPDAMKQVAEFAASVGLGRTE